MNCDKISLSDTGYFSRIFIDYLKGEPALSSFFRYTPELASFKDCIKNRNFDESSRKVLVQAIKQQYGSLQRSDTVASNINKLVKEKTFTVTTGHQLNLFTGPLYFIFKIITVINTCKKLKQAYPDYDFVPVYWMASEDHDLDEIRSFTIFGNHYSWDTSQIGPVGRMDPSSIRNLIDLLPEKIPLFEKAYTQFNRLADSVRYYVNELFGDEGIVVLDGDSRELKNLFKEIIKDDLDNHHANDLVESTSARLTGLGYGAQVYPRAINLFYMNETLRGRIFREQGIYRVMDSELSFTSEEILSLAEESPEIFSPNVILRPVYQETILPNIAYVGGPAEVAYWLQLKEVFDFYKVPFPVVIPRNFAIIIGRSLSKKMKKLMLQGKELFEDNNTLKSRYLAENASYTFSLESEKKILNEIFESIQNKTKAVDQSLEGFIGAEKAKVMKEIENIEKRLEKAEEKKQETAIHQIGSIKEKLFPEGNLQERVENFLSFYVNDPVFLNSLIQRMDPFDYRFNICYEE
jgi:bacillithiol biosynthesis cysteine-adding enzyme BshC